MTGVVNDYAKKSLAENAAKNISGVKAVVEKIEVQYGSNGIKTDNELAREVLNAFKMKWAIPNDKIKVKVENGWVNLEGELQWNYQREIAKKVVSHLTGVKGISNHIAIISEINEDIEKKEIERYVYDSKSGKIYTDIKIDSDAARKELAEAAGKALGFAQKIVYVTKETLGYLLAKASLNAKAIENKTQLNVTGGTA